MKSLSDSQKLELLTEHKQRLLDILEHEIRELQLMQYRVTTSEKKEIYYDKILVTREIQTIINNI
tara:strand:+ start:4471 stop:4665 length:195 start_codon:yes stop_codon:yes gene_type:complete